MAVKKVDIPGVGAVTLQKRRGASGMRLSVGHDGQIRVSMPYWVPYATGAAFVKSKKAWLQSQQSRPITLNHGTRIGKGHTLNFIRETDRQSLSSRVTEGGEIRIYMPAATPPEDVQVQKIAHKASVRALKQQAERLLPQRLAELASTHGFNYRSVQVKQLKSRWGSCSDQKDIALNLYLMQLPWHLIDYVLLHELMHTRIMAHGPVFWDELSHYVPGLPTIRKQMKSYRPILSLS